MKSYEQLKAARVVITNAIQMLGLSNDQRVLLCGMSTALQWACDEGGSTLQRLVDGEPLAAGTTVADLANRSSEFPDNSFHQN